VRRGGNQPRQVYIYIDPRKQVGDVEHPHVFNDEAAADGWSKTHERYEGTVAGSYRVHRALGCDAQAPGKVCIYVDINKDVGDAGYLVVFEDIAAAEKCFAKHDPEGAAFQYAVREP